MSQQSSQRGSNRKMPPNPYKQKLRPDKRNFDRISDEFHDCCLDDATLLATLEQAECKYHSKPSVDTSLDREHPHVWSVTTQTDASISSLDTTQSRASASHQAVTGHSVTPEKAGSNNVTQKNAGKAGVPSTRTSNVDFDSCCLEDMDLLDALEKAEKLHARKEADSSQKLPASKRAKTEASGKPTTTTGMSFESPTKQQTSSEKDEFDCLNDAILCQVLEESEASSKSAKLPSSAMLTPASQETSESQNVAVVTPTKSQDSARTTFTEYADC